MKTKSVISEVFFYAVGMAVLLGFFMLSSFLIMRVVPEGNKDMVRDILTTLRDAMMLIIGYFYGSSKSSADKNTIIDKQLNSNNNISNEKVDTPAAVAQG